MKPDFILCVTSLTYNHSLYITDALNGFTMQKTNFPFVVLLIDDASTDGTQEIIRTYVNKNFDVADPDVAYERDTEYANITYAQHKDNRNCYIVVHYLKYNHYQVRKNKVLYLTEWKDRVKYEALCEGDDYWTDPFKLQKQVDFLDAHPEAIMCFHNAVKIYENEEQPMSIFNGLSKSGYVTLRQLINSWIIPTASIVYRTELMNDYPKWSSKIYSGDLTLSLVAFSKGKIYYFHGPMSVYRINRGNGTSMSSMVKKSKIGYVESQHITLYEYYDEYTNYVYHDILSAKISELRKEIRFQKNKNRSLILAIFSQPLFFVKKLVKKFFS